ncbi:GNAT family N-acetyltransferase [Paenibacillus rigui]|uniref:GNAT family N-acetyltransferase n=1 Tax=Paenibacillus rigui TaxID=554312 RepID=A0A229UIP6_9BACL|nr:GNAT family N-acetyltransferase [Paenibacillus rigui]OXM82789.1 GNAT family N-acetyltransferase [Paenibacillus rigui]
MAIEHEFATYRISDDKTLLELDTIYSLLHSTYWAGHRSQDQISRSIEASVSVGVYDGHGQIGFLRAVTDGATFTWICDVVVHPEHRGKGIGKQMMHYITRHPSVCHTNMLLGTRDAHGLYKQYGFVRKEMMIRRTVLK